MGRPAVLALAALCAAAVLLSQIPPELTDPEPAADGRTTAETLDLLRGAWVREYTDTGHSVRRVLTLEPGGGFREKVRVVDGAGVAREFENAGFWLYDGTNLKRKYTSLDGEPPSRLNVPFATFQISFGSRNEFTGVDHVHRHTVHYRRLQ